MSCGCDGGPSVIQTVIRLARKEHRCCEGKHVISPGERYAYTSGVWDGRGDSFKQCMTCHRLFQAIADDDACYCPAFMQLDAAVEAWIDDRWCRPRSRWFPEAA